MKRSLVLSILILGVVCLSCVHIYDDCSDGVPTEPTRPQTSGYAGNNVFWNLTTYEGQSAIVFKLSDPEGNTVMEDYSATVPPYWVTYWSSAVVYAFGEGITHISSYVGTDTGLSRVVLPSSVKEIGAFAFKGTDLTEVTLPEGLESIGQSAFQRTLITKVVIPDSVTHIGGDAFSLCSRLTEATVGSGVTVLNQGVFAGTKSLETLNLGENVQTIGRFILNGSALQSLYLPKNVAVINGRAFSGYAKDVLSEIVVDPENGYFAFDSGVLYNKDRTELVRALPSVAEGVFQIPDSVRSVSEYAFYLCDGLTSINIPDTVSYIGSYAFMGCSGLNELSIPDRVTRIAKNSIDTGSVLDLLSVGNGLKSLQLQQIPALLTVRNLSVGAGVASMEYSALRTNPNLESIEVGSSNPYLMSLSGVLFNSTVTQLILYPSHHGREYVMPNSVVYLGDRVFKEVELDSISLSTNLRVIGRECFEGCPLESIKIPASVRVVGNSAFRDCDKLEYVYFEGDTVPSIGSGAFAVAGTDPYVLRVYSPLKAGFLDSYCVGMSIEYYPSDVAEADGVTKLVTNTWFIIIVLFLCAIVYSVYLRLRKKVV